MGKMGGFASVRFPTAREKTGHSSRGSIVAESGMPGAEAHVASMQEFRLTIV
jgi:hypothetical protein